MKTVLTITLLPALTLAVCSTTTTSYEKGLLAGASARIVFDAPQDEQKFAEIKEAIEAFLASGRTLTDEIIMAYAEKVKADLSPAVVSLVTTRLRAELDVDPELSGNANEFLRGLADAL